MDRDYCYFFSPSLFCVIVFSLWEMVGAEKLRLAFFPKKVLEFAEIAGETIRSFGTRNQKELKRIRKIGHWIWPGQLARVSNVANIPTNEFLCHETKQPLHTSIRMCLANLFLSLSHPPLRPMSTRQAANELVPKAVP